MFVTFQKINSPSEQSCAVDLAATAALACVGLKRYSCLIPAPPTQSSRSQAPRPNKIAKTSGANSTEKPTSPAMCSVLFGGR